MRRAPTNSVNFREFSYVRNRKAGSRALRNSSGVVPFWRIYALRKGDRIDLGFLNSTSGKTRREQIKVAPYAVVGKFLTPRLLTLCLHRLA